jgi:hypothetical protein
VDDRNICLIDKCMREAPLLLRNLISPIWSPMDRRNDQVACPVQTRDFVGNCSNGFVGKIG